MILKINFEVSQQALENKNLAKLMSIQGIWKEFVPFCKFAACGSDYRDDYKSSAIEEIWDNNIQ